MTNTVALDTGAGDDTLNPIPKNQKTWGWFPIFNVWANISNLSLDIRLSRLCSSRSG